jgi:hypothetical protein
VKHGWPEWGLESRQSRRMARRRRRHACQNGRTREQNLLTGEARVKTQIPARGISAARGATSRSRSGE